MDELAVAGFALGCLTHLGAGVVQLVPPIYYGSTLPRGIPGEMQLVPKAVAQAPAFVCRLCPTHYTVSVHFTVIVSSRTIFFHKIA